MIAKILISLLIVTLFGIGIGKKYRRSSSTPATPHSAGWKKFGWLLVTVAVICGGIVGIMCVKHELDKDGPPPPSATDPTRFRYTLTIKDGAPPQGNKVDWAYSVRMSESSTAAISFYYIENSGTRCEFNQRLGVSAETGRWSGTRNGYGTFKVTEFIPGKVSRVSGMMWYEKSGYGIPTGESRIYYFTLEPSGKM